MDGGSLIRLAPRPASDSIALCGNRGGSATTCTTAFRRGPVKVRRPPTRSLGDLLEPRTIVPVLIPTPDGPAPGTCAIRLLLRGHTLSWNGITRLAAGGTRPETSV